MLAAEVESVGVAVGCPCSLTIGPIGSSKAYNRLETTLAQTAKRRWLSMRNVLRVPELSAKSVQPDEPLIRCVPNDRQI